ncbi:hypothetical protein MKEN_01461600 [Mycena kentingensis (nom. inval.)]|nr:hypothetical protein MKEN_01461600 [Mycena kentingensis (nom. inval.)]
MATILCLPLTTMLDIRDKVIAPEECRILQTVSPGGGIQTTHYLGDPGYAKIYERTWGGLTASSPCIALTTDIVDTAFALVFHCEATDRSVLAHVVSLTEFSSFSEMVDWVTDGDRAKEFQLVVFNGRSCAPPCGAMHNDMRWEPIAERYQIEDAQWISEVLSQICAKAPGCKASIHPKALGYGCLILEKAPRSITLPQPTSYASAPPFITNYFLSVKGTAAYLASGCKSIPCWKQYDGAQALPLPATDDATREAVRIAAMHPHFPQVDILSAADAQRMKRTVKSNEMRGYIASMTPWLQRAGAPCEVESCRKISKGKCSTCSGAFYCCREHQSADWARHKAWCKEHKQDPKAQQMKWVWGDSPEEMARKNNF